MSAGTGFPPEGKGGAVCSKDGEEFSQNPEVDEAAAFAVQQLSSQSNSLFPYQLKKVLSAKAHASTEGVTHHLKLRVGQGTQPDQVIQVEVASSPRAFHLKSMQHVQHDD